MVACWFGAPNRQGAIFGYADIHLLAGLDAQFTADDLGDYNLMLFGNCSFHIYNFSKP